MHTGVRAGNSQVNLSLPPERRPSPVLTVCRICLQSVDEPIGRRYTRADASQAAPAGGTWPPGPSARVPEQTRARAQAQRRHHRSIGARRKGSSRQHWGWRTSGTHASRSIKWGPASRGVQQSPPDLHKPKVISSPSPSIPSNEGLFTPHPTPSHYLTGIVNDRF